MVSQLRTAMAQINFMVGAIEENAERIIAVTEKCRNELSAHLVIFPELALTGYPPEDLLLRPELYMRVESAINKIKAYTDKITVIAGFPEKTAQGTFNSAAVISRGEIVSIYRKHKLPNYSVFDEKRYFISSAEPAVININNIPVGLTICEDAWYPEPIRKACSAGAKIIININASPYHTAKNTEREEMLKRRVNECKTPVLYVNMIGGQDELVFDGASFALNSKGEITHRGHSFKEDLIAVDFHRTKHGIEPLKGHCEKKAPLIKNIYNALVLGVRDYINKNRFSGAVIGLSGGIDSALTLAIAADAIGSKNVEAVSMPSRYTADMSIEDAKIMSQKLGVDFSVIPIESAFKSFLETLKDQFKEYDEDTTEENIQARCRGVILMAISNKKGKIVLTTGNKSEMAVGYATLYGDMAGGFCVLKDVSKTLVYKLSRYRNSISRVIPGRIISRPPSAELAPNQKDEDSLPPYDILDPILEMYIEQDKCIKEIVNAGYSENVVKDIAKMVDRNEYKRRQAPPGVRITERAFGRDRRYPITSRFGRYK